MKHRRIRQRSAAFQKKPLTTSIALALGAATMSTAQAEEVIEEVVTTGIRGSLMSATNLKRDSQGLVDGIVSEDIGKFPDTNLAESLQRIPGVSIDRSSIGEGQRVTVRGVGPDFNLVLLNGRQMPGASIQDTAASGSRAFDFANLASEAISAVEIYKTGRANIPTGGIGATVNIVTAKPLASGDTIFNVGVKGVIDESRDKGDSITPEVSGIFSTTNDDETLGIAVTASYQDRNLGYNQAGVANGYPTYAGDEANWGTLPFAGDPGFSDITNRPDATDIYGVPQNLLYSFNEVQRERINGQVALQFRPVDTVTATLDYTYSENKLATERSELSAWFNFSGGPSSWTDGPAAAPLVYTEELPAASNDLCSGGAEFATKNTNNSLGFNVEWDYSDRMGFEFDYHSSSADAGEDSPYGSNAVIGVCGFYRGTTTADFRGDFPILSIDLPAGQTGLDASQMLLTGRSFRNSVMDSEVDQAHLSGFFEIDDESTLDFGIQTTDVNNLTAFTNVQVDSWGGFGTPADYPDDIFGQIRSVQAQFDSMPGGGNSNIFPSYFDWDFETVRQAGAAVAGSEATFLANPDFNSSGATNRQTEEETLSLYLQYNRTFDWGGKPGDFRVGIRYEDTDVTSSALVPEALGVTWVAANEQTVAFGDPVFTTLTGQYDYWLPSIDFNIEVAEGKILRASYGKSIGRPGWNDIQGGQSLAQLARVTNGTGNSGNPGLLPLESTNYDISFEWYYGSGSYAALAYFRKDIENYIGNTTIQDTPFNLPNPADGPLFDEAVAAVGNDFVAIRNYIFANYDGVPGAGVTQTGVDANGDATGTIEGIAGRDNPLVFNITVPTNEQSADIDGWEFAIQHMFGESGFGASANFTVVDSDAEYDNTLLAANQFAVEGLSDSANLIGFYEDDKWSVRLAYNWRDKFLSGRADGNWKGLSNPIYTDAYGQWDMNVSYNVNDNLTVFAEGINITDEVIRLHGRNEAQTFFITQTGPRYMIGARYNIR